MPTPDGKYIAVADCGLDYIYLYDAKTYQKVFEWKAPEDSGPRQLRFSPDGKYLYMVSELSDKFLCLSISRIAKICYGMSR